MKKKILLTTILTSLLGLSSLNGADKLLGQGATFPMPIYKEWSKLYYKDSKNQVSYNGGGSGKGISAITSRNGNFGGTDSPLTPKELKEAKLLQFPSVIGSVVLAYNIKGIKDGELKLSPSVISKIFSGKITKWNDTSIKKDNPNLKLPNTEIMPVVRSDSSGTTFNFTSYLAKADKEWDKQYGANKSINWGAKVIPANGNPLVASTIKQIENSIGYIEYAYKIQTGLNAASLQNKNGDFVKPVPENFSKAALNANFTIEQDFYKILAYGDGKDSYPIVAASFILIPSDDVANAKKVYKFFKFAFNNDGAKNAAKKLGYEPLPKELVGKIESYLNKNNIK